MLNGHTQTITLLASITDKYQFDAQHNFEINAITAIRVEDMPCKLYTDTKSKSISRFSLLCICLFIYLFELTIIILMFWNRHRDRIIRAI